MKPTIGRIVIYRTDGRNGISYDLPAIITCTPETHPGDYPDGSKNPLPVPDEGCVHLTVFSPGGFGTTINNAEGGHFDPAKTSQGDAAYKDAHEMVPGSGTYVEWNVDEFVANDLEPDETPGPRTWRWPVIAK